MYLRICGISLIEPILYKVVPASPIILRPGSIHISGNFKPLLLKCLFADSTNELTYCSAAKGLSSLVYVI